MNDDWSPMRKWSAVLIFYYHAFEKVLLFCKQKYLFYQTHDSA